MPLAMNATIASWNVLTPAEDGRIDSTARTTHAIAISTSGAFCQASSVCSRSTSSAAVPTEPNRNSAASTRRRKAASGIVPGRSVQRDVALEPRDFLLVDVLADLTPELLDRLVGPVLLELAQHALPHPGNGQNVRVARRIQVDGDEHVLLEAVEFLVIDVFADFAPELSQRAIRSVLLELAEHALPESGNHHDFSVRCRVEIDLHEQPAIDVRSLLGAERLPKRRIQLGHLQKRPPGHDGLHDRRRQA